METKANRATAQCVALRQAAAYCGQRSCAAGARLEENSLAGRQQRLAKVSLLGGPGTAFPWISRGPRPRQRDLAAGGVAGKYCGAYQVFLLRSACRLQSPPIGASRQSALEDRAGLSATQGGTRSGSL